MLTKDVVSHLRENAVLSMNTQAEKYNLLLPSEKITSSLGKPPAMFAQDSTPKLAPGARKLLEDELETQRKERGFGKKE